MEAGRGEGWEEVPSSQVGVAHDARVRKEILDKFRAKVARGKPIIGGGAGTGISAKCEEAGGIDLIVIYNSGRFRMAGRGSLAGMMPYGDANAIVMEMAARSAARGERHARSRGVCGTDPFRHDASIVPDEHAGTPASPACRTSPPSA